jgi:PKD repeat protein
LTITAVSVILSPTSGDTKTDFSLQITPWSTLPPPRSYTISVWWGDGSPNEGAIFKDARPPLTWPWTHRYTQPGTYTIQVIVSDIFSGDIKDGTRSVTVTAAPTLTVTASPTTGIVGKTVFSLTIAWSPPNPEFIMRVDWGNGIVEEYSFYDAISPMTWITQMIYRQAGTFTITATMPGVASATTVVTVITEELTITFASDKTSGPAPLAATFTCGATKGQLPYAWTLDPGDGSSPYSGTRTAEGTWTQGHTYNKVGTFTAKLTVTDALGASLSAETYASVVELGMLNIFLGSIPLATVAAIIGAQELNKIMR